MEPSALPWLLGLATLLPLASFFFLLLFGSRLGKAWGDGAYVATGAIAAAGVLSAISLLIWLGHHFPGGEPEAHAALAAPAPAPHTGASDAAVGSDGHAAASGPSYAGEYYLLGQFGKLRLSIGYYIDSLTICMFCLVTVIATCIHFYAMGYMHDEQREVTDREVTLRDGTYLTRRGRYVRFFQYLSLFSFSMLGLVLAGNIFMVFVFWELVGICSYFLIGFYIERPSACCAANKAFIVNRVGDVGMIVGLMALWGGLGTFAFGDLTHIDADGARRHEPGIFSLVRPVPGGPLRVPDGMVRLSAHREVAQVVDGLDRQADQAEIERAIAARVPQWRDDGPDGAASPRGYALLVVAGIGIFCGCVGKSAQFPLHVWLPDAMEGPTPVSALVHSATMVAAGVYLVGRFFPVFTPEVLLVIALVGCLTLFMAATIAITATDIKRVLAYSTVSQLGYMMLALGVGGWVAGLLHLITHAFFKSLLFLCSGSVIHAVHTNDMRLMGGLRKKMPITAYTMLIGCLAITGISVPFVIGLSGYYSKDRVLEQAYSFMMHADNRNFLASLLFYTAAGGAMITAFYMFRMWYLTFVGEPRDADRYAHAHESPRVMTVPLMILAVFAVAVAWSPPGGLGRWSGLSVVNLLEQSRPPHTLADVASPGLGMTWPNEHFAHEPSQHATIVVPVTWLATLTAWAGIALATVIYALGYIQADEVRRYFARTHRFLLNKWWFDELYALAFIRPVQAVARLSAALDRRLLDGLVDGVARWTNRLAKVWDRVADSLIVDGSLVGFATSVYRFGVRLQRVQTGRLRDYVVYVAAGALAIFVAISFFRGFYWGG